MKDDLNIPECGHGNDESPRAERRVRIFELCLVLSVAFGSSIFTSVYPLLGDMGAGGPLRNSFPFLGLCLEGAVALALLSYVLWRSQRSIPNPRSPPASRTGGWVRRFRQVSLFEWGLVFMVAFWRHLAWWPYAWLRESDWNSGVIVRNIPAVVSLVDMAIGLTVAAFVLKRSGRSFLDLGLRWSAGGAALALPLLLLHKLLNTVQWPMIYWLGQTFGPPGWQPPDVAAMLNVGGVQIATSADILLVGFYEELIVRAYVMTEIISLTHQPWLAILISVAIQTSYHFYQGVPLALLHVMLFTVFALFYAKTRLVLPVALAHSLVDLSSVWNYGLSKMFPY